MTEVASQLPYAEYICHLSRGVEVGTVDDSDLRWRPKATTKSPPPREKSRLTLGVSRLCYSIELREPDLNRRPRGYEPRELPGCSIPQRNNSGAGFFVEACFGFFRLLCDPSSCGIRIQLGHCWISTLPGCQLPRI